jgi:hypothetical protein
MGYNKTMHTRTMNGLYNSGADLLKHMYDIRIWFPSADGAQNAQDFSSQASYPVTVRATGFNVPDVAVGTYQIGYHGMKIARPNANFEGDRTFEITFREDAAFELRRRFSAWLMAVGDPVTGGVSNMPALFGTVMVGTIGGTYYATTMATPDGKGDYTPNDQSNTDLFGANGDLVDKLPQTNPLVLWGFYNCWVSKLTGVQFQTEATDANQFTVTFQYMHMDMPAFGGNTLNLGQDSLWKAGV